MNNNSLELKDFQRATVDRLERRLIDDGGNRMLVADEVGLGKTIVAKGFIERMLAERKKLSVIYICNNQQIARQNLRKLNVTGLAEAYENHDRLTLAFSTKPSRKHGLRLLGLSPQTSLSKRSRGGTAQERLFLLYLLWDFAPLRRRKGVLSRFLRLDVGQESWRAQRKWRVFDPPTNVVNGFKKKVRSSGLYDRLNEHFDAGLHRKKKNNRGLIAELRHVLIEVSIDLMKPDLIILDEFQRFRELLSKDDADDETSVLAQRLFRKPVVKILLLSATPYRMYVQRGERRAGEDHYADFRFLIHFLLEHDEAKIATYENLWSEYQSLIDGLTPQMLQQQKELGELGAGAQVQRMLRSMVCRTERASLTQNGRGMVRAANNHALLPEAEDLLHYRQGELLTETFRAAGHKAYSPLNFYKSAPYPFTFMEGYQLSKLWRNNQEKVTPSRSPLSRGAGPGESATCWLPLDQIAKYQEIPYPNAAFRYLQDHAIGQGREKLLWVPPACPEYPLAGAFAEQKGFSKTLLFSQWRMVPRAVSALLSYEAERRTVGRLSQENEKYAAVNYFNDDKGNDQRAPVIFNELTKKGDARRRLLEYPSLTLARMQYAPALSAEGAVKELEDRLLALLRKNRLFDDGAGQIDFDWYWQFPLLLDQANYGGDFMARLYETALKMVGDEDLQEHCRIYANLFRTPRNTLIDQLGQPPTDLLEVVAQQTIGSPAVASLRVLLENEDFAPEQAISLASAIAIADSFRKFFNRPETAAAIRVSRPETDARAILNYCIDGNLTAVLREYLHVVIESQSLHAASPEQRTLAFRNELLRSISLRASPLEAYHPDGNRRLRTHFAAAFLTDASNEKQQQREGDLRSAFNSPFRPFVLASTSVGQEGLDFHYYARHLVHWNLPHNPVDLEQREGRVNRYKSHAVRLGLAHQYNTQVKTQPGYWNQLFRHAAEHKPPDTSDLVPFWHLGDEAENNPYPIVRHAPHLLFSKDARQLTDLLRTLPLYRLVLGMPDQEGLLKVLGKRFSEEDLVAFGEVFGMELGGLSGR
jgi:hypothetical protein